jgi:hypothetical protein
MKNFKIYFLSSLFIFVISTSNAQLGKGNLMVGGSLSTAVGNGSYQLGLYPSCGYFFTNNVVLGGAIDLSYYRYSNGYNNSYMALSAMGRYYFTTVKEDKTMPKLPLFLQAKLGITSSDGQGVIFAAGGLGFDYFLTSNVALEGSAGINLDNSGFSNVYAMLGLQIFLPSSLYSKTK